MAFFDKAPNLFAVLGVDKPDAIPFAGPLGIDPHHAEPFLGFGDDAAMAHDIVHAYLGSRFGDEIFIGYDHIALAYSGHAIT